MDGLFSRGNSLSAARTATGAKSPDRFPYANAALKRLSSTVVRAFLPRMQAGIYNFEGMYSARLLDHFQNPRNAGDVANPDATAEIENPACGDVLRLTMKIEDGRIAAVGFKAKGCVPSMACASALTEMIAGKTITEARGVQRDALIMAVGGVPEASTHSAQLALDALSSALKQLEA